MTMAQAHQEETGPPARKKLVLKPRDPQAAEALERQRLERIKSNPFGDAKPREAVIAQREGKDEKDVVKAASEEYQVKLRLSPEQIAEKRAAEDGIKALRRQLEEEEDEEKGAELKAELAQREAEIAEMIAKFEQIIVEQAKKGTAPRLSERRAAVESRDAQPGAGTGYGGTSYAGGYQDRRSGDRSPGSYGRAAGGGFHDREGGYQGRSGGYGGVNDGGFGDGFGSAPRGGRRIDEQGGSRGATYEAFSGGNARKGGSFGSNGFSDYKERGGGGGGGFGNFQDSRGGSGDRDAARGGSYGGSFGDRGGAPRGGKEGGFGGDRRGGFADYQDRGNEAGGASREHTHEYPMGASDVDYQSPYRSGGGF